MDPNIALSITNLSKEYRLYDSELDRLKEAFNPTQKSYHKLFHALKDINIQIKKGEKVGFIGSNGAGKSTLLKIITGVLTQTTGEIEVDGKIAALLELGAGFNQNYTGIENIRLNGTLSGQTEEEINQKMQQIADFADIGDFINQPVKLYSSGMFVRLAFATQIFSEPDVLIVDEALSVGDLRFQQKCYRAMDSLMKDKTVLLVTHDTNAVNRFCQRVIWLNHGQVMYDGEVTEGLKRYQEFLINQAIEEASDGKQFVDESVSIELTQSQDPIDRIPPIASGVGSKGSGDADIIRAGLFNDDGELVEYLEPGKTAHCVFVASYKKEIPRPILGIEVFDRLGNTIFSINTEMMGIQLPAGKNTMKYDLQFTVPKLNHGEYTISPGLASGYQEDHIQLCWLDDALLFNVSKRPYDIPGFFYLDRGEVEVSEV